MDKRTLEIVEPTEQQLATEPERYIPIPVGDVEAVKAMSTDERLSWLKMKENELANRKERRKQKRARKAGRAARKRMRAKSKK